MKGNPMNKIILSAIALFLLIGGIGLAQPTRRSGSSPIERGSAFIYNSDGSIYIAPNVGIGTTAPRQALDVDGFIYAKSLDIPNLWADVKVFGAKGDGVTDDTTAIQNAIDSLDNTGGKIIFPAGTYSYTKIYFDSTNVNVNYIMEGVARNKVILKPKNLTADYSIFVNQTPGGSRAAYIPAPPQVIIRNFRVDGSDSTSARFIYYNTSSFHLENVSFNNMQYVARGTGYSDGITIKDITWRSPVAGGYIFYKTSNGDNTVLRNIFTDADSSIYLGTTAGGEISGGIGGKYFIYDCYAVTVKNNHLEVGTNTGSAINIINSDVNVENNFFYGDADGVIPTISINMDTPNRKKGYVVLRNNAFGLLVNAATDLRPSDVFIGSSAAGGVIIFENNKTVVIPNGYWADSEYYGIKVTSSNAGIQATINGNLGIINGYQELRYINGAFKLTGSYPWNNIKTSASINTPTITSIGTATKFPGNLVDTTVYYYKTATYTQFGHTAASTEVSKAAVTNKSMELLLHPRYAPSVVRLWRGTSAGVYDRYVDLLATVPYFYAYDMGNSVSGTAWVLTDVPVVPSTNTTSSLLLIDNSAYIYASSAGNIGIGSFSPRQQLDVDGKVYISENGLLGAGAAITVCRCSSGILGHVTAGTVTSPTCTCP